MAHRKNTRRSTHPEPRSGQTEEGNAELALARELGRLIGKHLARQFSERGESVSPDDRRPGALTDGRTRCKRSDVKESTPQISEITKGGSAERSTE